MDYVREPQWEQPFYHRSHLCCSEALSLFSKETKTQELCMYTCMLAHLNPQSHTHTHIYGLSRSHSKRHQSRIVTVCLSHKIIDFIFVIFFFVVISVFRNLIFCLKMECIYF